MTAESDDTKKTDDEEKIVKPEAPIQEKTGQKDNSKVQSQSSTNPKPFMIYAIPKAGAPEEAVSTEGMTYDQVLAKTSPKSSEKTPERVSRTLIDFVVPPSDKLDISAAPLAAADPLPNADVESASPVVHKSTASPAPESAASAAPESSASVLHRIANAQSINRGKDSYVARPPEVPPPMRRKRGTPKTMLDILVSIGNQLTGAGHAPETAPDLESDQESVEPVEQQTSVQVQSNPEEQVTESTEYYSNEAHYPAPDYSASSEPQTFYQGADGQLQGPEEARGERISRTLLDHSVLFDTVSKSAEKMILKAAEEQKEKLNEPFVPFFPVQADRISSPCPWKWEGDEVKERVKYCDMCKHQVYNFAGIEKPEAEALVFKHENQVPKTLFKRADGKFMSSDCPVAVKQTRGMVLAVVMGLFLLVIAFACMLLAPQPPKQTVVNTENKSLEQPTPASTSRRRGMSSTTSGKRRIATDADHATSGLNGGSAVPTLPPPAAGTASAPLGSNGGYGPISAPTPAANDFQWNYPNDAQKNPAPIASPNVSPAPSKVDRAQAAELQRLKQQIIDNSGSK
jgi:hypothetical protein